MTVAIRFAETSRFHELHALQDDTATTTKAKVTMTNLSKTLTVILFNIAGSSPGKGRNYGRGIDRTGARMREYPKRDMVKNCLPGPITDRDATPKPS